jgi:CRISPR-associated protein Cmr4
MSENASPQTSAVLFLHAQTSLHPGSGTALGTVDLPVQRERHTQWPLIPGTSLKGVFRDACLRKKAGADLLFAAFGPDTAEADKHAGAISVTDARILAYPVRSLRGVFSWVTCAAVLNRFNRDASLAGFACVELPASPAKGKALCPPDSPLIVDTTVLVLEEFQFEVTGSSAAIADPLTRHAFRATDTTTPDSFRRRLVVLHDDDFTHFVRHATEVVARIGLDASTKTVKQGALFYQEFLPTETVMYALVFANASRRENTPCDASTMLDYVRQNVPTVLQIGGDETTGKGLCAIRLCCGKEGA